MPRHFRLWPLWHCCASRTRPPSITAPSSIHHTSLDDRAPKIGEGKHAIGCWWYTSGPKSLSSQSCWTWLMWVWGMSALATSTTRKHKQRRWHLQTAKPASNDARLPLSASNTSSHRSTRQRQIASDDARPKGAKSMVNPWEWTATNFSFVGVRYVASGFKRKGWRGLDTNDDVEYIVSTLLSVGRMGEW